MDWNNILQHAQDWCLQLHSSNKVNPTRPPKALSIKWHEGRFVLSPGCMEHSGIRFHKHNVYNLSSRARKKNTEKREKLPCGLFRYFIRPFIWLMLWPQALYSLICICWHSSSPGQSTDLPRLFIKFKRRLCFLCRKKEKRIHRGLWIPKCSEFMNALLMDTQPNREI